MFMCSQDLDFFITESICNKIKKTILFGKNMVLEAPPTVYAVAMHSLDI